MTTNTTIGSFINTSDATFRDWVGRVITMLTAVGLEQTADTGQINPATVSKPVTTVTMAGYAIFRLSGPPGRPIFIRIDFGTGSSSTYPSMSVTVCKGTDGAGEPVGVLVAGSPSSSARAANASEWRASGGPGYVALCPVAGPLGSQTSGSGTPFLLIERSPDGGSVLIVAFPGSSFGSLTSNSSSTPVATVVNYDANTATAGAPPVVLPYFISGAALTGGTPLAAASLGPVFPWVLFPPALAPWQSRLAISYPGGDMPGSAFQVTLEGEDRTYLPIPLSDAYCAFGLGLSGAVLTSRYVGLAIRWE